MITSETRRIVLGFVVTGVVVVAAAVGSAPVGAAPHHAAAAAKTKDSAASLVGVSVVPHSTTAWAVGTRTNASGQPPYALRRHSGHWAMERVSAPKSSVLKGVGAVSSKLIWAVGDYFNPEEAPLIERSRGGGFTRFAAKGLGTGALYSVSASSKSYAWAVGGTNSSTPLAARWNGKTWKPVTVSTEPAGYILSSVSVLSPKDVWASGSNSGVAESAHWDGHTWTLIPYGAPAGSTLDAIAAVSGKSVWAAGYDYVGTPSLSKTLTYHWTGAAWVHVPSPSPLPQSSLSSVAVAGARIYATGSGGPKAQTSGRPIALRLIHGKWHVMRVAKRGKFSSLASVSVSSKSAAAVGTWYAGSAGVPDFAPANPLAEKLVGNSWRKVPAPK